MSEGTCTILFEEFEISKAAEMAANNIQYLMTACKGMPLTIHKQLSSLLSITFEMVIKEEITKKAVVQPAANDKYLIYELEEKEDKVDREEKSMPVPTIVKATSLKTIYSPSKYQTKKKTKAQALAEEYNIKLSKNLRQHIKP